MPSISISGGVLSILFCVPLAHATDWYPSDVSDIKGRVSGCVSSNSWGTGDCDLQTWKLDNVNSLFEAFKDVTVATDLNNMRPICDWDTSHITDMSYTFSETNVLLDCISNWDTSHQILPIKCRI